MPPEVIIGSFFSAIRNTLNGEDSCRRLSSSSRVTEKTSKGPQKSSTSTSLNSRMPTTFCLSITVLLRKEFLGCQTGAATEGRPYRAFHCCGRRQLRHDGLLGNYRRTDSRAAPGGSTTAPCTTAPLARPPLRFSL